MSTAARRRLMRDFKSLQTDPPEGVNACPNSEDIFDCTHWEGGTFTLKFTFSEEFPNKPPKVRFLTKMFHPNVYPDGAICLDLLQNQWSPIYDISAILTSIQSLLPDPNPHSPANSEAATLCQTNKREYNRRVRACVESSWEHVGGSELEEEVFDDDL